MKNKILVIHSGGTISCQKTNGTLSPSADISYVFKELAKKYPKLSFSQRRLKPFLSEYLDGAHISRLVKEVRHSLEGQKYSGVILTHGSDTLCYTAAALSLVLGTNTVPVVTVCADLPISEPLSSGRVNLDAATALILSGEASGVFSVYRESESVATVHRGSRMLRHRAYEVPLSSADEIYGKIDLSAPVNKALIKNPYYSEREDEMQLNPTRLKRLSPVSHITVSPGMNFPAPPRSCKAVILGSYHSGTIDTSNPQLVKFTKICKKRGIALFVDGTGANADYESMTKYTTLGITRLPPLCSPAAMYMKLWLLIAQGEKNLHQALCKSVGADIVPR